MMAVSKIGLNAASSEDFDTGVENEGEIVPPWRTFENVVEDRGEMLPPWRTLMLPMLDRSLGLFRFLLRCLLRSFLGRGGDRCLIVESCWGLSLSLPPSRLRVCIHRRHRGLDTCFHSFLLLRHLLLHAYFLSLCWRIFGIDSRSGSHRGSSSGGGRWS